METEQLAEKCKSPYFQVVVKEEHCRERGYDIHCGLVPVRLPEYPEVGLRLVVVKGLGKTVDAFDEPPDAQK